MEEYRINPGMSISGGLQFDGTEVLALEHVSDGPTQQKLVTSIFDGYIGVVHGIAQAVVNVWIANCKDCRVKHLAMFHRKAKVRKKNRKRVVREVWRP